MTITTAQSSACLDARKALRIRARYRQSTPETTDQDLKEWELLFGTLEPEDLAPVLVDALGHGDNKFAEVLWQLRGPFEVRLVTEADGTQVLNGVPGDHLPPKDNVLNSCGTVAGLKQLFANIRHMNAQGLVETAPGAGALLVSDGLEKALGLCREARFEGKLPTLSNGRLSQPELLFGLMDVSKDGIAGTTFEHVLCWASPEMARTYPDSLHAFHSVQNVTILDSKDNFQYYGYEGWAQVFESERGQGRGVNNPQSYNLTSAADVDNEIGQLLLHSMGSPLAQHGFLDNGGMVLCSTTTAFLAGFEVYSPLDPANLRQSESFVASYLPLDLLCRQADKDNDWKYPLINGVLGAQKASSLISILDTDAELSARVAALLSPAQWTSVASTLTMDAPMLLGLQKAVGIDNSGMSSLIRFKDFDTLYEQGYKFSPRTVLKVGEKQHPSDLLDHRGDVVMIELAKIHRVNETVVNLREKLKETYIQLVSMGLWPVDVEREPTDLRKVLEECARQTTFAEKHDRRSLLYRAWLVKEGVEACVAKAKTPREMHLLVTVLGDEAMRPYVDRIPLATRGQMFTRELGV